MEKAKPDPRIVFLSDADAGPECSGPNAVAFYLSRAFPGALDIRLFNYVNNHLYKWDLKETAFVDCGGFGGVSLYDHVCEDIGWSKEKARKDEDEDEDTLFLLKTLTSQPLTRERHFFPKLGSLPSKLGTAAQRAIEALLEGRDPETVCFVICPNARNIPAGLLAFNHKLSYGGDGKLLYTDKNGKTHDATHLKMKKAAAAYAVTEIALCQAIIKMPEVRYLGNCYGSQVMWVALGYGLTTFKRHSGVRSGNTVVSNNDVVNVDVRWSGGICISEPAGGKQSLTEVLSAEQQLSLFHEEGTYQKVKAIEYNTDYHHSFMMVAPNSDSPPLEGLALCKYAWSEAVGALVERGSLDFSRKLAQLTSDEGHKFWVGMYSFEHRIFGFQGHPLYHLTEFSSAWNATRPTCEPGDQAIQNPCFLANQFIIWELVFGFPTKAKATSDKRFHK